MNIKLILIFGIILLSIGFVSPFLINTLNSSNSYLITNEGEYTGTTWNTTAYTTNTASGTVVVGNTLYMCDRASDLIYIFYQNSSFNNSIDISAVNNNCYGLTYNGSNLFSLKENSNRTGTIFKHNMDGTYGGMNFTITMTSWGGESLSMDNGLIQDYFYVGDETNKEVYGINITSHNFAINWSTGKDAFSDGLTIYGDYALITTGWGIENYTRKVNKLTGVQISNFSRNISNSNPRGITTNGSDVWIYDWIDKSFYQYKGSEIESHQVINLTFNGLNQNYSVNFSIKRYANFTYATMNLSDVSSRLCYQESANVSNQTGIDDYCALNYNGVYDSSSWVGYYSGGNNGDFSRIIDGIWNSNPAAMVSSTSFIVNYSITNFTLNSAYWNISFVTDLFNWSIPDICRKNTTSLQYRLVAAASCPTTNYEYFECYNGTSYQQIGNNTYLCGGIRYLSEESIIYNISADVNNVSVQINNTNIWNFAGSFNQSNNKTNNFASTLNYALNNGKCDCTGCTLEGENCTIQLTAFSNTSGILQLSDININYDPIPFVYLINPENNTYSSVNKTFSCNSSDELNLSNVTLFIWNSTGIYNNTEFRAISGTSNLTTFNSINFSSSDTYKWNCMAFNNNSYSNWFSSNYTLVVNISAPTITLNYPTNNIYLNNGTNVDFNCAVEGNQLDSVFLYGNFSGVFNLNNTIKNISSGTVNNFKLNLTDSVYSWTCAANKSSDATLIFSQYGNYSLVIDTIKPFMNDLTITTTANLNQFTFLTNIIDLNMGTCKFSILDGATYSSNTSFTCNSLTIATAPGFGTYKLFVYTTDLAGNNNSQNLSFTTSITSGGTVTGGGGNPPTILTPEEAPSKLFSILNTNLENKINIQLAKNSVRPREKQIIFINRAKKPIEVELTCDTTDVNKSSRELDICAYVKFPNKTLILNANEDTPTESSFYLYTPLYSDYGENYYFNILATDQETKAYSKLSVSSSVSLLSTIFYKWSYISKEQDIAYPVFLLSLFIGSVMLIFSVMIFQRKKLILTGLMVGLALFFASIGLMTLIL